MATLEIPDQLYDTILKQAESQGVSTVQWLEQLLQSKIQLQAIFDNALDTILLVNDARQYIDANPAACELLGYNREELIGKSISEVTPVANQDHAQQVWEQFAAIGRQTGEYVLAHKDGSTIIAEYMAVRDILPGVHLSILHDVTAQKEMQVALRQSEARYRAIAEHFPNGLIALYDHDLRYTVVNGEGLAQIAMTGDDLNGKRLRDIFPPEIYERDEPALLAALRGETTESIVSLGVEYFRVMTLPVRDSEDNIISGMVMSQNITALRNTEVRQKELNDQLTLAIDTAKIGMWTLDLPTQTLHWNSQQHRIYGISPEAFAENMDGWRDCVHPEDRSDANSAFSAIFTDGSVYDVGYRIIRPDGQLRYIKASGSALYDEDGNITKLIGVNLDVTEYELSRQALAASEARYRALFDESLNAIVVYDEQANILMVNRAAAHGLGCEPYEMIGKSLKDFIPQTYAMTVERIQRVLESNKAIYVEDYIELAGQAKWFWSVIQPLLDGSSDLKGAQVISIDITERKRAQEIETERAQLALKLEQERSLAELRSRLISIISHEFRTPLAIIMSASELLTRYYNNLSTEQRELRVSNIVEQVRHLTRMLDEISMLSKSNRGFLEYSPASTDVGKLGQTIINDLRHTAHANHTLRLILDIQDQNARLDEKLMYHALANLVANAIKYSPQGGDITLQITQVVNGWEFSVTDQGLGIPAADQHMVFEPFSRAGNVKDIGGTGLGLSIVREVVEQHGGRVNVESDVGKGSTFTIFIPQYSGKG